MNIKEYKVGIIGGGLSGLTTAYMLFKNGISSIIFEANDRLGGRVFTEHFPNGQIYELGGEFIDSNHKDIINLINELNSPFVELVVANNNNRLISKYVVIDYNKPGYPLSSYEYDEIFNDYKIVFPRVKNDFLNCWPEDEDTFKPNFFNIKYDNINLNDYIDDICAPLGGKTSKFAQLLKIAYTSEFGLDPIYQSSLNLILMMGDGDINEFNLYGISDEKFKFKNGASELINSLYNILISSGLCNINLNSPVTKIKRSIHNFYELTVDSSTSQSVFSFHDIVITIPFQSYKFIDYTEAGFSPLKKYIINNSKLGNTSKLILQFNTKFWEFLGYNGYAFLNNDLNPSFLQNIWNSSQFPHFSNSSYEGTLSNLSGGHISSLQNTLININPSSLPSSSPLHIILHDFLTSLFYLFPTDNFDILNISSINWSLYPWIYGGYSAYRVGQYSGGTGILLDNGTCSPPHEVIPFAGKEHLSEPFSLHINDRNCHFAGEGTTVEWDGFLNGAVFSGKRAANEIITRYKTLHQFIPFTKEPISSPS